VNAPSAPAPADFAEAARRALLAVEAALDDLAGDGVETDIAEGLLTIEFEDGDPFVLNVNSPAQEIWLSANRRAWHFAPAGGTFVSTAGDREPLMAILGSLIGEKLGRTVVLGGASGAAD
jgi:iron donor protein CyaY